MSDRLEEFHVRISFELAGQRRLHRESLCEALAGIDGTDLELDGWVRIVDYKYSLNPLSTDGSLKKGGRFNIGRDLDPKSFPVFPTLYVAENYDSAYAEKFGSSPENTADLSGADFALRKPGSFTSVNIDGQLANVFDLTRLKNLKRFVDVIKTFSVTDDLRALSKELDIEQPLTITTSKRLRDSLLAPDWRYFPVQFGIPANPQVFGRLLVESGFTALLYQSTKANAKCLALFPENLAGTDGYLQLSDPPPDGVDMIRLDAATFLAISA